MELGNHADFLNIMPSNEMLSRWFINDTMKSGGYRLKHHAIEDFWRWLTSWAVCISKPKDLGQEYDMPDFELPPLHIIGYEISANQEAIEAAWKEGRLFPDSAPSSTKLGKVKRCNLNDEADALREAFPEAVEVRGSDKLDSKTDKLLGFSDGKYRILITKAKIAGHGMNWQNCANAIFFGLDYSFESFYQAKGRNHRYGQKRPVNAHIIYSETEGNVIQILNRKQADFLMMQSEMTNAMGKHGLFRDQKRLSLIGTQGDKEMIIPQWLIDNVEDEL
jgi:hypothetical protein